MVMVFRGSLAVNRFLIGYHVSMQEPVVLYFDVISPYAWLAWQKLPALVASYGRVLRPVPVLFAAMLEQHGTRGPAEVPAKRAWVIRDVARHAIRMGLRFNSPPAHPFNPLLALRVMSLPMPEETRVKLIDGIFTAVWGDGPGVTDPEVVEKIAASVGLKEVMQQATTPEAKDRVRKQTEEALEKGAFGVPTMLVDGELFWGFDSLVHVEDRLAGRDRLPKELVERWDQLPAAAVRRNSR
jgi:2-hydroxychromene-2-carboxylate isomerase